VLRHPTDEADLAPQPGVGQIAALIEHERSDARAVTLHVDGTPGPMPASVDLGIYRILEEALSTFGNTGTAVDVVLRFGTGDVALTLTSETVAPLDWPTPAMCERAALCGGSAAIESVPGHGERLVVRMPCLFDEAVA
jgi:signal transduction histidine kinase